MVSKQVISKGVQAVSKSVVPASKSVTTPEYNITMRSTFLPENAINAYKVYYRYDGEKVFKLAVSKADEQNIRAKLRQQRRKYLGTQRVKLVEVQ